MAAQPNNDVIYQPDEQPPHLESLSLGFQRVMGRLGSLAARAAIIALAAAQPDDYVTWLVFTAFLIAGLGTVAQTFRFRQFGSGYPISVNSNTAFVAVVILALEAGGPALLSSLIAASALLQFLLVWRLSLLRRLVTPLVSGTVLMLLAGTIMAVVLERLAVTPEGAPPHAAPIIAAVTFAVIMGLRMFAGPALVKWTPVIGIASGCAVAAAFGLFDVQPFLDAPWIGAPTAAWPGLGLDFGTAFWALLPGFLIVNLAATIYVIGDVVAMQQVSWRRPRAPDFRVVQGALNVIVAVNFLSAALGGLPNAVTSTNSSHVLVSGVAARRMGLYAGLVLIAAAFLPKLIALLLAVPKPVFGAYVLVALAMLFVQGMRMVVEGGLDGRKAVVVGVSFWLGVGFQNDLLFPDLISGVWETLLGNGMTTGAVSVIVLSALLNIGGLRRRRLRAALEPASLPRLDEFLREAAAQAHWDEPSTERLRAAGEETLSSLLPPDPEQAEGAPRRLIVSAHGAAGKIELEFVATSEEEGENLEDRLAYLADTPQTHDERELSFRLLRHYASSVQHRKYHEIDVVTVEVDGRAA